MTEYPTYGAGEVATVTTYACGHRITQGGGRVYDPAGFLFVGTHEYTTSPAACGHCEDFEQWESEHAHA